MILKLLLKTKLKASLIFCCELKQISNDVNSTVVNNKNICFCTMDERYPSRVSGKTNISWDQTTCSLRILINYAYLQNAKLRLKYFVEHKNLNTPFSNSSVLRANSFSKQRCKSSLSLFHIHTHARTHIHPHTKNS